MSQTARFQRESGLALAIAANVKPAELRRRLPTAMAAVPRPPQGLDDLDWHRDWHRVLDALILVPRPR